MHHISATPLGQSPKYNPRRRAGRVGRWTEARTFVFLYFSRISLYNTARLPPRTNKMHTVQNRFLVPTWDWLSFCRLTTWFTIYSITSSHYQPMEFICKINFHFLDSHSHFFAPSTTTSGHFLRDSLNDNATSETIQNRHPTRGLTTGSG